MRPKVDYDTEVISFGIDMLVKIDLPDPKDDFWDTLTGDELRSTAQWKSIEHMVNAMLMRGRYSPDNHGLYALTTERDMFTEKEFEEFAMTAEGRKLIKEKGILVS